MPIKKTFKSPFFQEQKNQTNFWNEVAEKSESLIANLIEKALPISAIPKVFNLEKDAYYQSLLKEDLPEYYSQSEEYWEKISQASWTSEDIREASESLACAYFDIVIRHLIGWLKQYSGFESTQLAQYEE